MKVRTSLIIVLAFSVLMGGATVPIQRLNIQRDLATLTKRGFTYRMLDDKVVELAHHLNGEKHLKSLREPNEAKVRSWAAQRGIPILEIDPNTIDTSQYAGWFTSWITVPLGNSSGVPLIIADLDHNGCAELYGAYLDTLSFDYRARIYEVDSSGSVSFRHQIDPRPGVSRQVSDADMDSLSEVAWSLGGIVSLYEQPSSDSLPISLTLAHDRHYHNSDPGFTGIYVGELDSDSLTDFLYQGTGPDPNDTNIAISKTYVAEYNATLQTFERVWSTQFVPGSGAAGFSVGDFDGDGEMEFIATHGLGRVFVAENTGDNQYTTTWQDSTPFVNLYYHGSGDVDNDGKVEFFTGATMSNGNWVVMYEADSNDAYSAKFLFHLLSGGIFAEPVYTTTDIDGDGQLELAMLVGADLYIFKSNTDNEYYLWYLKREDRADAVAFYDFNNDGLQDIVISKFAVNSQGRGWLYADIYLASELVNVREETLPSVTFRLLPNYPNPFNPQTTIEYVLTKRERVTLSVYNVLGQHIATLVDQEMDKGHHTAIWDASGAPSGVYLCRLEVSHQSLVNKLLLIR